MPNLKDIRNRITSVKSTQKITKAMKMVAAAKLRRAQEAVVSTRPYSQKLIEMIEHLTERVDREKHPLLRDPEIPRVAKAIFIAGDRGLCGAYNSNVLKTSHRFYKERRDRYDSFDARLVGRKSKDFFKRRPDVEVEAFIPDAFAGDLSVLAQELAEEYCELFAEGEIDELFVIFTRFHSPISQEVVVDRVLPLRPFEDDDPDPEASLIDYIYEPDPDTILSTILPQAVAIQIQRALLESEASEHGSRMTAMDNATNNAGEMIESLTLQYNRARQAAITTELIEIVSGAEAV